MGRKKILITGAAGRIGQVMRTGLRDRYDLRLMYHRTVLEVAEGEEVVLGSVADMAAIEAAVDGVDAVVHMAGDPRTNASWESVLEKNIQGVYCTYEACRKKGGKHARRQGWAAMDRFGIPIKVNGERIPGPANIIDPHADFPEAASGGNTSQGHCALCG